MRGLCLSFPTRGDGPGETLSLSAIVGIKPERVHGHSGAEPARGSTGQLATDTAWPRGWTPKRRESPSAGPPSCAQTNGGGAKCHILCHKARETQSGQGRPKVAPPEARSRSLTFFADRAPGRGWAHSGRAQSPRFGGAGAGEAGSAPGGARAPVRRPQGGLCSRLLAARRWGASWSADSPLFDLG